MRLTWTLRVAEAAPQRLADRGADALGWTLAAARPEGVVRLEDHLAQLSGEPATRAQVARSMGHYMRAFSRSFAMGGLRASQLDARVRVTGAWEQIRAQLASGPGVVALTHAGDWDLAGAWACRNLAPVVTVAEQVDPPALFEAFMHVRRRAGMQILPVRPGQYVFRDLVAAVRGRGVVAPLLADRDITGSGVEVDLAGRRALVAAGPAALALACDVPVFPVFLRDIPLAGAAAQAAGTRWGIEVDFADPVSGGSVADLTQAWVDALTPKLRAHPEAWHMLQRVFVDELDPARLARARERARKERA